MEKITVRGKAELGGSARVAGFKHALGPILAASVMVDGLTIIDNVPEIGETRVLASLLSHLGVSVKYTDGRMEINPSKLSQATVPDHLARAIHGSLYLMPGLLGRLGTVDIGPTGGCQIGAADKGGLRPTEHMIDVLERFGASFETDSQRIRGKCNGFKAATINIQSYSDAADVVTGPLVSGATKTAILAAAVAQGRSVIHNPYTKPDVTDLLSFLDSCGVPVKAEDRRIVIDGRASLNPASHHLVSDVIEIITFVALSVYLRQSLRLEGVTVDRARRGLQAELMALEAMGVDLTWHGDSLTVYPPEILRAIDIEVTSQSIYSDSHPFFALMLLSGNNQSTIIERVWKDRFDYAYLLNKLGAELKIGDGMVTVRPAKLGKTGEVLRATDLRGAAVALLAGLGVDGETHIEGISHLQRGYENLPGKLQALGADLTPLRALTIR